MASALRFNLKTCRTRLGDKFVAADATVQAKAAEQQVTASLERLAAIAAQNPSLGVQDRLQAVGIVLSAAPAAGLVKSSTTSDSAAAGRTKRPTSAAELGTALSGGNEGLRRHSRPSSVSSASSSRIGSVGDRARMRTVQLVLDIA